MTPTPEAPADTARSQPIFLYKAQEKIYPRSVSGRFVNWRWLFVWLTQLAFYGTAWIQWNGRQALLFDLEARRFYIGPLVLYPQDFIYLTGLLILSAYALFLFTAVAGRLWCGYACPQTVYTELFLWLERRWQGDRAARMRLDKGPWTLERLWRATGKQTSWIALSLWTGFTFVGYFTPIRELGHAVVTLALGPWESFWVLFYGFATYGNAGYLREQVCKYMCPYARFQSAMFDKDTLIITYDQARGEPRGPRSKKVDPSQASLGSCVDCGLCVQVCPTGIDIRKGLQYECIGCAACVDVCDEVMDKFGYRKGLVRYDTQNGLTAHLTSSQKWRRIFRPRVLIYGSVLLLISAAMLASLVLRPPFRVDVVRDRATLARQVEQGEIENVYRLQLMNASEFPLRLHITAEGLAGLRVVDSPAVTVAPTEARWVTVALRLPSEHLAGLKAGAQPIHFVIEQPSEGPSSGHTVREKTTFLVPR